MREDPVTGSMAKLFSSFPDEMLYITRAFEPASASNAAMGTVNAEPTAIDSCTSAEYTPKLEKMGLLSLMSRIVTVTVAGAACWVGSAPNGSPP